MFSRFLLSQAHDAERKAGEGVHASEICKSPHSVRVMQCHPLYTWLFRKEAHSPDIAEHGCKRFSGALAMGQRRCDGLPRAALRSAAASRGRPAQQQASEAFLKCPVSLFPHSHKRFCLYYAGEL